MIRAADCAVDKEIPPPPLLSLYWQCQRYGALPEQGGLYDQPAGELERMTQLYNIYYAHQEQARAHDGARWADDNPGLFRIIAKMYRLRNEAD